MCSVDLKSRVYHAMIVKSSRGLHLFAEFALFLFSPVDALLSGEGALQLLLGDGHGEEVQEASQLLLRPRHQLAVEQYMHGTLQ